MTRRTKIDVHARTFSMKFGDNMVRHNIFKAMKYPTKNHSVFRLDMINPPALELKSLPEHLRYAYLEGNKKFLVIIANKLSLSKRRVICRFILHRQINIRPPSPTRLTPLPTLGCRSASATPQAPSRGILRHLVSSRGIEVDKEKIDIISSFPQLATMLEVRFFLGQDVQPKFQHNSLAIVQELKKRLTTTLILHAPDWELLFELMCDASNMTLSTILGQRVGKRSHVIAYASCTLDSTQTNYTTTKKEFLAIVFALDKFRSYLLSSKIIVFSHHAALQFLLKKPNVKPRLICWMFVLQEFDIKIINKSGVENLVVEHH
ncbi:Retrovirus-related Pol polyprotein from transposon opus, partial [Mucuna pruriens]